MSKSVFFEYTLDGGEFQMNRNIHCISKDFLRNAYPICEGVEFSYGTPCASACAGDIASYYLLPLMRTVRELSEEYICNCGEGRLIETARSISRLQRENIGPFRRGCSACRRGLDERTLCEAERIKQRALDELRDHDACERINSDYIGFILPLLYAKARFSELFLGCDSCSSLWSTLRKENASCRAQIRELEGFAGKCRY